ncbi:MAG: flagellar hook protein FlgE, partial [Syntrophomonadaceae bacterium]|nr:flagellar hook protein FlgE [Syntrophomonadaceae bacterium]
NNIANVNTTGFKKSRVVFQDTLYQSIRGASNPTDARGGTNPMAVGLGMKIASIDQIHTPSPATITNKVTDLAIDGNGYFIVDNGGQKYYTRAGNFDFDKLGNMISMSNGYRVHGWIADEDWNIDTVKATEPIDISAFKSIPPKATTEMKFAGNLNSNIGVNYALTTDDPPVPKAFDANADSPVGGEVVITSKEVYDKLGNKEIVYFRFFKAAETVTLDADDKIDTIGDIKWYCDISLDPEFGGTIGTGPNVSVDTLRISGITFDDQGILTNPKEINLVIDRTAYNTEPINITTDFSSLTQWESKSTAWAEYQDGYTMGNLTSYTIGIDGVIQGIYDNGESRNLARVAIANFQNPAGLLQAGNSLYQVSNNSGDPLVGAPGEQGMGALLPGSLEMSNVDLSEEFTDMIITQRGFQANSRIITTSDEMLQELVNLKR